MDEKPEGTEVSKSPSNKKQKLLLYSRIAAGIAALVGAHQLATCSSIDEVISSAKETTDVDKTKSDKKRKDLKENEVKDEKKDQDPKPNSEKPKQLNIKTYVPPADLGTIVERKEFPNSKKTVVYLPDKHTEAGLFDKKGSKVGFKAQEQLYRIVEDVLDKQSGPITLVIESWPEGKGTEYLKSLNVNATNHPEVAEVAHIRDRNERIARAHKYIGKTFSPAGDMLAAAYPDRIIALGVENPEMEKRRMIAVERDRAIRLAVENGTPYCATLDPSIKDRNLRLREVMNAQLTELDAKGRSCLCKAIDLLFRNEQDISKERLGVGLIEAKKGVAAKGDVVFIMAGAMHFRPSKQYFEENRINYIVIEPNVMRGAMSIVRKENLAKDRSDFPEEFKPVCRDVSVISNEVYLEIYRGVEQIYAKDVEDTMVFRK